MDFATTPKNHVGTDLNLVESINHVVGTISAEIPTVGIRCLQHHVDLQARNHVDLRVPIHVARPHQGTVARPLRRPHEEPIKTRREGKLGNPRIFDSGQGTYPRVSHVGTSTSLLRENDKGNHVG